MSFPDDDLVIEFAGDEPDQRVTDDAGNVTALEHGDGSITITIDGSPLESSEPKKPTGWFDNLVEDIDAMALGIISSDLLRGIEDDLTSRQEWIEARTQGMRLLGLTIELPGISGGSDGAPVEGMSKVRHPLLLEAVLRFQANARAEMLPTDGPVKIRNDDNEADLPEDELADALEMDLNHFLTTTASEYYPDTDRMFLLLGFGGTSFKKVYFCPLRNRPVSESVDADDLIVNSAATDLANAKRVTHRIDMRPSTVRRMQILSIYRDIPLSTPNAAKLDSVQREKKSQQGVEADSANPEDRDREIYECYCELDIKGFEHKFKGKVSGLEIPYRVTIDVSSQQILSIVRNYNQDSEILPEARVNFVKYTFVPGFGFYDIGLVNILGNTTNALTAGWREMLDNGMYANFPGFLQADTGGRQNTNIFRVPPGGGAQVKTNGMPIKDAIMPLPYNTSGQAALQSLIGEIAQTGMRIGGTSEAQVGEGRADAPVGTTLAMIDQATKMLNSVHKRMHAAQAQEFSLLIDCFRENPDSFWQRKGPSKTPWDEQTFLRALNNCDLVPQADPNTASHTQRVMKIMGLKQLQAASPQLYDPISVDTAALQALGWSNADQFFVPPSERGKPPPEMLKEMEKLKIEKQDADARTLTAQAGAEKVKAEGLAAANGNGDGGQEDTAVDIELARLKKVELDDKREATGLEAREAEEDRQNDRQIALIDLAKEEVRAGAERQAAAIEREVGLKDIASKERVAKAKPKPKPGGDKK